MKCNGGMCLPRYVVYPKVASFVQAYLFPQADDICGPVLVSSERQPVATDGSSEIVDGFAVVLNCCCQVTGSHCANQEQDLKKGLAFCYLCSCSFKLVGKPDSIQVRSWPC